MILKELSINIVQFEEVIKAIKKVRDNQSSELIIENCLFILLLVALQKNDIQFICDSLKLLNNVTSIWLKSIM